MLTRYVRYAVVSIVLFLAVFAGGRSVTASREAVILPNGMHLKREFSWSRSEMWVLFGTDGRTRLAQAVEFICFNDRYVFVHSLDRAFSGLYDAEHEKKVRVDNVEAMEISGLSGRDGCTGYYTAWVGPGLLIDGALPPFVPLCDWRNMNNDRLRDRAWFDRPCRTGS